MKTPEKILAKKETLRIHSLAEAWRNLEDQEKEKIKLVVADVDYTLVDFEHGHQSGIAALKIRFGEVFARRVNEIFQLILTAHRIPESQHWDRRADYQRILEQVQHLQGAHAQRYGPKVWSRETYFAIAAQEQRLPFGKEEIESTRDLYWNAVTEGDVLYSDAREFVAALQAADVPIVFMVGSDSILTVDEHGDLVYDPDFSETYKKRRLHKLSIPTKAIIIGDPVDKPNPKFFEKVFRTLQEIGQFGIHNTLVVGDSERNDLEVPREYGFITWLIQRI